MGDTVKIRRIGAEPATCITYAIGKKVEPWHPDPQQSEFDVDPLIARAAVDSGFFEAVVTKPKETKKPADSNNTSDSTKDKKE